MKNSPSSAGSPNNIFPSFPLPLHYLEFRERVRYSETDQMGVAHNKSYFEWFELGRTEFCRKSGLSYRDIEAQGIFLVVAEAYCRYRKPLRYDDTFIIRVGLSEASARKIVFSYELRAVEGGLVIATGHTLHLPTNRRAEVCSLPEDILAKIKAAGHL
ncbi:MAG TPA: thioesterase family protein [Acidobacteriota bacterium]